ncbi:MAG TPA: TIGR03986 family CRISPR-associated RAMP protein [Cyanobacteria bacterium UBA12227]|nr:TIGR03986 family CRISPR-associated RAMP protein [Cyanobacteria bacterium UBA12227]HAX89102.1 TIGR03986 family CRISPR-associated RAMP protein [Cyanobacteria bacterium UBA11370]HBY76972.1 TIGR03986 family CRISPR-associated RAMP protein [Cyanobacteria bacterium UBA11148]
MSPKHISQVPEFIKDDKGRDIPRRAIAPYNFVELPHKVVEAEDLPSGDRYHPDYHTGRIECTLTTESPLYIRCGMTPSDFIKYSEMPEKYLKPPKNATEQQKKQWEEEKKQWETERRTVLAPFFTYRSDLLPVLPGSSLRGMLRTLVEIVSFSKIDRVSDEHRLFFRAVASNPDKESWGQEYKKYVEPKKVKAGYLKKDNQGWYIQPAETDETEKGATFAWVRENSLSLPNFKKFNDDKYQPQYIPISYERADVDKTDRAKRLFAHNVELPYTHLKKGVLVTSGHMKQGEEDQFSPRRNHCIVFAEDKNADPLRIDDTAIAHYRNALTDFQKESPFDKDWGVLKLEAQKDRPVFYSDPGDEKIVGFFGQSPNFRIPYSLEGNGHATTVVDFIPKKLSNPYIINWSNAPINFSVRLLRINFLVGILFVSTPLIDLAEAIFGWVKQQSKEKKLPKYFNKQRAGRIFVTDAVYQSSQNGIFYETEPLTPQILSEPKPSYFPHYLVQPNVDKLELKHYASQPITETVIRGHKLYWHKGSNPDFKLPQPKKIIDSTKKLKVSDTQITRIKPIKKGVTFKFTIHFENLSKVELGALLWVLSLSSEKSETLETGKPDEKYCFSLGMGKPLGMGAVKIDYELYLNKRKERYSNLFNANSTDWKTGEEDQSQTAKEEGESVKAFEKYVLDRICCQDYLKDKTREQLQHLKELPRIEMLLAMLRCDETPQTKDTRYMTIDAKEYQNRPVLPTPLDVIRIPDNRRCDRTSSHSNSNLPKPIIKKSSPAVSNPKTQSNSPKPKPTQKTERDEGGNGVNFATQRPPKPPKR